MTFECDFDLYTPRHPLSAVYKSKKPSSRLSVASAEDTLNRPHGYKRLITPRRDEESPRGSASSDDERNEPDAESKLNMLKLSQKHLPPIKDLSAIGLAHLEVLSEGFNAADDSGEGLDKEEFVRCFSAVLSDMDEDKLENLFMKIDANSDGTVTWEEFSSYMLEAGNVSEMNNNKQSGGRLV